MSLFAELRRRSVFKVGAAYAIVAWLLLQITDIILPTFEAPLWVAQTITFLLAIGFPIAVILAWAFDVTPQGVKAASDVKVGDSPAQPSALRFGYISQALILLAVGYLVIDQYFLQPQRVSQSDGIEQSADMTVPDRTGSRRYMIALGPSQGVGNTGLSAHVAISRDGTQIVYATQLNSTTHLYHRPINRFESRLMLQTDGAQFPFFSQDGNWVVFYSDDTDQALKRISLSGGAPQYLASAQFSGGGSWADDGSIIFSTQDDAAGRSLFRISNNSNQPESVILSDDEKGYVRPEVLPGSGAVLVVVRPGPGGGGLASEGQIVSLSLADGEIKQLIRGGYAPRYSPTGHIVFGRDGDLWAVPFDVERLATTGDETVVIQQVEQDETRGGVPYDFSDTGTLVYLSGAVLGSGVGVVRELVWVDRDGNESPVGLPPRRYRNIRLSPNGERLAASIFDSGSWDIWISDLARGQTRPLTLAPGPEQTPVWMPSQEHLVYMALTENGFELFSRRADGAGAAEPLRTASSALYAAGFSPNGVYILLEQDQPGNIFSARFDDLDQLQPLADSVYQEVMADLSPDGQWIAYASNARGRFEIFVRRFPDLGDGSLWQVTTEGGTAPKWGPDGQELFYLSSNTMMRIPVELGETFSSDTPVELFDGNFTTAEFDWPVYDIHPSGDRFLMMRDDNSSKNGGEVHLLVVENWFEELNRLAPTAE